MNTKLKKILIYIGGAIIVSAAVYKIWFSSEDASIVVETTAVKTGTISTVITATGTVEPITQVEVGTQVSGVIDHIYVDYNATVKAGQLIAELDKTALKATVAEATAALNTALNEQDYQQKSFDRIAKLHDSNVVSDTDYEEALYKLNNAKGIADQKRSDLSRARTNLSYASIYSPIDGVVVSRSVDVGQTVAASYSTPTLFTIAQDLKQMQVEADVDEADIGQVKLGQRVVFTVDAYPEDEFSGTITQVRLEPVEESNVITYTVIIKADNQEGKLMPGLTASISIYTLEIKDVLTLESKALNFKPDPQVLNAYQEQRHAAPQQNIVKHVRNVQTGYNVYIKNQQGEEKTVWVKEGDNIQERTIHIGTSDGVLVQVLEGLREGDEVVLSMNVVSAQPAAENETTSESPFMPKPPGNKKK
ncbi:efflux RND transporter periplasmic adaptor subunit [Ohtaekwangia koreensis]|uniref:HlyD family secretion protein n=1 Tax=Ohtaekwangia koreensis TaxID=688867 RepID=A0A1T5M0M4_9BACT|nr:efflux RND transporter periplasmic adaptor subunit [Ohtaekwangia koreensis]SKC81791.1 HlyD family secretion protein [Ohtaekwangia koreensis]